MSKYSCGFLNNDILHSSFEQSIRKATIAYSQEIPVLSRKT